MKPKKVTVIFIHYMMVKIISLRKEVKENEIH